MKKISRRNFLLASGAVTIGAALAACGGSSASTSTASSAPASSAASAAPAAQGKVLNIWCWNDEFQSRFNDYYPEVSEIAADKSTTTLKDGTVVKWTINANENNNYQNKLDEALLSQDSAADDDKIDIFLIEADYALKYVDSDYVLDVKADIGLTDDDLAEQYQYTKDIVTVDGSQRGTTWQATPGLFAYRRSIAKDVLGTDDPAEVQTYLSDWDKFNDVAAQAAAKGYKMLSGFDDAYRTFSNNVAAPWVTGTTVTVAGEQCQAQFCLHFRVGILEQFQKSRHGDGGFACGGYSLRAGGVGLGIEAAFKLLAQFHTGGLLDMAGKDFLEDVLRFF